MITEAEAKALIALLWPVDNHDWFNTPYIDFLGDDNVVLDGDFSAEQLEKIAALMRSKQV